MSCGNIPYCSVPYRTLYRTLYRILYRTLYSTLYRILSCSRITEFSYHRSLLLLQLWLPQSLLLFLLWLPQRYAAQGRRDCVWLDLLDLYCVARCCLGGSRG